jgi:hypothetical protein
MLRTSALIRASIAAAALAGLSQTADAARIRIDFAPTGFNQSGELFETDDTTFSLGSGAMPFLLNFGAGAQAYDFCFGGSGAVEFITQGGTCGDTPLLGNYIAPFSAELNIGGNTQFGTGLLDLTPPFDNIADATTKAIRFVWEGTDTANNDISTELMLWELGAGTGDFGFEMRYGNGFLEGVPDTGEQSFHLGNSTFGPVRGPFIGDDADYFFSFVGGACTSGCTTTPPPTTVEEPSSLALTMLGGLLVFAFAARQRLRRVMSRRF